MATGVAGSLVHRIPKKLCAILWRSVAACLAVLALSGHPTRLVTVGEPQQVETLHPKIGLHTRLTDEVEEWKIQRSLQMVREMGASWIVEYFPWAYYEPRRGVFDWKHADLVVSHAVAQGLTILARIDYVPQWARPAETTARYLDPTHYADYANFCAAFAQRYRGRIGHLIVWNEPNLAFEWGYRVPDPVGYTELLRVTYHTVKRVAPEVQVLAAGLAPTLAPPGSDWGWDDLAFLQEMYAAGAGAWMDGLAIHAYGYTSPADESPAPDRINFRRAELLRAIMVANGDQTKPAVITEGGWNDHPRWTRSVKPYQRIQNTIDAYALAERNWDWCPAVCLWALRFPAPQHTYQDQFTFVTPDMIPRPIYTEVQNYALGRPFQYLLSEPGQ